jgi:polyisoprenoid-binding protein YceI
MIKYLLLTACIVAPILLKAQTWTVQTANTSFRASMFGDDVDGAFKGFKGTVVFDPYTRKRPAFREVWMPPPFPPATA